MTVKPLVSVNWLYENIENDKLIILDCTIPKVTDNKKDSAKKLQIKNARFFDIKNVFSDKNALYPNTVLYPKEFEEKARGLGIYKDSIIVVYDDLGIYSSPRVWWMFKLMGFNNIAVLNGGLPEWKSKYYPIESPLKKKLLKGNFIVNYKPEKIYFTKDVQLAISNKTVLIVDARSNARFLGKTPEPRKGVKSGHIPNSISLPYGEFLEKGKMKSDIEIKQIFNKFLNHKNKLVFTCGSGITASILALAAEIIKLKNYAVYDGSWTEWGSTENLPIEL